MGERIELVNMYTFITCFFFALSRKMLIEDELSLNIAELMSTIAFLIHFMLLGELTKPIGNLSFMQMLSLGGPLVAIPIIIIVLLFSFVLTRLLKRNEYERFNKMMANCHPILTIKKGLFAFGLIIVPFILFVFLSHVNLKQISL